MVLRKNMKRMISLLLAASMVFSMAGCGGNGSGSSADADNTGGSAPEGDSKSGGESGGEPTAMGRYVEEQIDLSEQGTSPRDLCMREDGKIGRAHV